MPKQIIPPEATESFNFHSLKSLIRELVERLEPYYAASLELRQLSLELSWMLGRLEQGRSPFPENWDLILFSMLNKPPLSVIPGANKLARTIQTQLDCLPEGPQELVS
jgi:hypothetical protein